MSNTSPVGTSDFRHWWLLGGTVLLLIGVGTLVAYLVPRPPPPTTVASDDPRLAYQGPFRNVHPSVGYVGDDACKGCHDDILLKYQHHPMAHASAAIAEIINSEKLGPARHNPFEVDSERFLVERQGQRMWHREERLDAHRVPLWHFDREVHFVIGSGARGRSYVTNHDGYLFQAPVSWFTQKQIWDRSPGFTAEALAGRPVQPDCLFCHANSSHPHEGSFNRYDDPILSGHGIGCERCHGPGERHAASSDRLDTVSPKRLSPALRDAVCEQCHLAGKVRIVRRGRRREDFRPGLPLDTVFAIFVLPEELGEPAATEGVHQLRKAVNHVEQMHASRCYQGGTAEDRMGCTSCHDPHSVPAPERRVAFFRQRCLACHEKRRCSAPAAARQARGDSCFECHMPRVKTADIAHSAATDHRVLRKPPAEAAVAGPTDLTQSLPLRSFHRGQVHLDDPEQARDYGLALVYLVRDHKLPLEAVGPHAVKLLEDAVAVHRDDLAAYQGKAEALSLLSDSPQRRDRHALRIEALAAAETILEQQPHQEVALALTAGMSQNLGDEEKAIEYWQRAVAANPWLPRYRENLTRLLQHAGRIAESGEHAAAWLKQEPRSIAARQSWIICLLRDGRKAAARQQFHVIEAMHPDDLKGLRDWFDDALARAPAGGG
jgi:hypothetical protein